MKSTSSLCFQSRLFSLLVIASLLLQLGVATPVLATSQTSLQSLPFTTCADVTEIPQAECEALVALYNSTNGAGWVNNTNWLATNTPCSWLAVYCDGNWPSHITGLDLLNNHLNGSIPSQLGNLTQITFLRLSGNQLSGSIPVELGNLSELQFLTLSNNQLSGSIPGELGNLTQLINLDIQNNQFTGSIPAQLGNLTQVMDLWLRNNQLSGSIPGELGNLSELQFLSLSGNQLSGSIPAQLGNLTQLKNLELVNNQLSGNIPPELGNLTLLEHLWLQNNLLSGSIPSQLGNLIHLVTLLLSNNQLTGNIPPELGNLTQLQVLDLINNQLSGNIPPELGNLTQLTALKLYDNQLSGNIPPELGNLTRLIGLYLQNNQLTGAIPWQLGNLTQLTELALGPNRLTGDIPAELGNLTQLTWLNLSNNQLTGGIPAELGNLTQLTALHLNKNQLSGDFPASITNLVDLTILRFDCGLTSSDPVVIAFLQEKSNDCFPDPFIIVRVEDNSVFGFYWPLGTLLMLEIDDPTTPQSPDFTDSQVFVGSDGWENGFELDGIFDIQPGHLVTVSGGGVTKELAVAPLTVTAVDIDADTVSGTGDPGFEIHVGLLCDDNSCTRRNIYVDANGNWLADFSVPGIDEDETVFDIRLGSGTGVYEIDEDDDATSVGWDVPNPTFDVRANFDVVEGWQWNLDSTIKIEIDDLSTQTNPDYTDTAIVGRTDWDPSQTYVWFYLSGVYDIQTGDVVSLSDGEITKTTIVTGLAITDVHLDTDIVEGTAEPNQTINVWTCWDGNFCANRDETADQNGHWSTNFSIPGEQDWEQETADLQPGSWIDSSITDEDSDNTVFGWYVSDIVNAPTADAGPDQTIFAGATVILDATASSDPDGDALTYTWDLDNDGLYDDASGVTASISFSQVGEHVIGLQVTDAGGLSDTDTVVVTITPWTLKGFYQPVDMNGVYNLVKGGSTVPLKFEIFAGSTELSDFANIKNHTYAQTSCNGNTTTDEIELTATGNTSLRYASGQFIYNWKTPKTSGKCYRVTMMTLDGSSLVAYFKFK